MKKRHILLILILAALCMILAGCGKGSDNAAVQNNTANEAPANEVQRGNAPIADGTYSVKFDTDSSMFHVNEEMKGRGVLTVKDGWMTIHIVMPSKNIVQLYAGTVEESKSDSSRFIDPTTETVKYSDGTTEEVYAFDIPVPHLDDEFDCALAGTKGKWYDHKVSVSDPQPVK